MIQYKVVQSWLQKSFHDEDFIMIEKPGFLKRISLPRGELYGKLFAIAFFGMMVGFLPSMIYNKGIFLYYGDFNSQQMMFYYHANEAVRSGSLGWDWGTDLGANFISSYSFYLLGSPFFWLSTIFPLKAVAYLMPWLLALKTATAAITAYAYARRFVKSPEAAFVCGLLYAFSGFQTYNVFFNHFHDVTAFFPLLLLSFELVTQDNKKGPMALMIGLLGVISYFFLVCEFVFMLIYFFIRCTDKEFKMDFKIFGRLAIECVLGGMLACAMLLPAVLDTISNPRVARYLYGLDMVVYAENVRIPRIFQAFFMLSDMPARVNIFDADKGRWASLAGYLPMFSMCGVIAFMRTRKKQWQNKMMIICTVMACVPVLNSAFIMFNSSYYTRWFYMPILIMCLMTAQVIDEDPRVLREGFIPTAAAAAIFVGIGLLPKQQDGKTLYGLVPQYPELYYVQGLVTAVMYVMLFFAVYKIAWDREAGKRLLCVMTTAACVICMASSVIYGVVQGDLNPDYIDRCINGSENLDMAKLDGDMSGMENTFYRIDTSKNVDNWCMYWGLKSMRAFQSVVPVSLMTFYKEIGQTRDVASRMETNLYPLRGLFSVKYYFSELNDDQLAGKAKITHNKTITNMSDFEWVDMQNGFNIFENKNFVPMGFAFDEFVTDKDIKNASEVGKTILLMQALVLDEEQAKKYHDIVSKGSYTSQELTKQLYDSACEEKRAHSCYYFKEDSYGFDAKIKLEKDMLVFFSVPYESGWTAEVNGEAVDVECVDYGFMAVRVPAGDSTISFHYKTPGLAAGRAISLAGVLLFAGYVGYAYIDLDKLKKRRAQK